MSDRAAKTAGRADLLTVPEAERRHEIVDVEPLIADRDEVVRAEPFPELELELAVLLGDEDEG